MLKWTLQTVTLISVLHASIPVALTETGWLLVVPPSDTRLEDILVSTSGLFRAWIEEPSEEKRETLLKNFPPISNDDLGRLKILFQKMASESSLQKRVEIFYESTLREDAPLSNWKQIKAFDLAADCERQKRRLETEVKDELGDNEAREITEERFRYLRVRIFLRASRCVPASLVYPVMP